MGGGWIDMWVVCGLTCGWVDYVGGWIDMWVGGWINMWVMGGLTCG